MPNKKDKNGTTAGAVAKSLFDNTREATGGETSQDLPFPHPLLESVYELGAQFFKGSGTCRPFCIDHQVAGNRQNIFLHPKDLAEAAFDSVASHRFSEFSGDGNAKAMVRKPILQYVQNKMRGVDSVPSLVNL